MACQRAVVLFQERNARLFREDVSPVTQLLLKIKQEAELWIAAGASSLGCLFGE
ncbi:hypothetical protein PAHAL_8G028100 [Panicum hallii]|uniref:Uncharacterized protein n=1 Tax=Panicum hallii TaxID=206008 RepID=A0A2T8I7E4_9POAL|nr:hypothetical protein PAHAL_8G028100 [Panicum hallii]